LAHGNGWKLVSNTTQNIEFLFSRPTIMGKKNKGIGEFSKKSKNKVVMNKTGLPHAKKKDETLIQI